jgi:hypothetical protein
MRTRDFTLALATLAVWAVAAHAGDKKDDLNDPTKVDADFAVQGEYTGELTREGGKQKTGMQVIARGGGKFHAVLFAGGLPGDGYEKGPREEADGQTQEGVTAFTTPKWIAKVKDGTLTVADAAGKELGQLKRVIRESPTLGAKPPEGAVVLFDGTSADKFQNGRMTEDKLLKEGPTSKQKFQNQTVHLEYRLAYMPTATGQGRSNSGCYLQGRFEVQILDSFGLVPKDNECGGIYSVGPPRIEMCFPPLSWQTYDIDFTAAVYEGAKKVKNARVTVRHNGVVIHENQEVDHATTAAPVQEGAGPGPLYLQDHGNPVRFRNVWIVEKP